MSSSNSENCSNSVSPLINFYYGRGRTISSCLYREGYTLDEILGWSFDKLEYVHDYIQWLFPLTERSAFNPKAPILADQQIKLFMNDEKLIENLIKSFKLMMRFYGFCCEDSQGLICVKKAVDHDERISKWLKKNNHNYLRITRILKSLKILGLNNYSEAFLGALNDLYLNHSERISDRTYRFWVEAVNDGSKI
jgi:hypothetical protein